jgi:1,4-alpha-glucan branching enzyme
VSRFSDLDLHLFGEGRHFRLWEHLGAHPTETGCDFAVWAPNARAVHVVGDFNHWASDAAPLEPRGASGIWEGGVEHARGGS